MAMVTELMLKGAKNLSAVLAYANKPTSLLMTVRLPPWVTDSSPSSVPSFVYFFRSLENFGGRKTNRHTALRYYRGDQTLMLLEVTQNTFQASYREHKSHFEFPGSL
ncbi:hypothetical protein L596_010105 [Steinernema carpocapsae]|uniref:Uncharacterized protein n=1 Tax=Steinernema carpocapsae TaxID=34508 RepID=A0A4U5PIM9_STECR|nr:hypothetical protein L596_010105 [Steinernema carpocapsae]